MQPACPPGRILPLEIAAQHTQKKGCSVIFYHRYSSPYVYVYLYLWYAVSVCMVGALRHIGARTEKGQNIVQALWVLRG